MTIMTRIEICTTPLISRDYSQTFEVRWYSKYHVFGAIYEKLVKKVFTQYFLKPGEETIEIDRRREVLSQRN